VTPLEDSGVTAVGHVIQLSVAPVFLLSAIGALLVVLTNRLARVIDRARLLEAWLEERDTAAADPGSRRKLERTQAELRTLSLRARLIHRSITLSIVTAVLVCSTIVALFVGTFLKADVSTMAALLFVGAMFAFLGSLLTLMRELFAATSSLRFGTS
jgi:hypothetical protein